MERHSASHNPFGCTGLPFQLHLCVCVCARGGVSYTHYTRLYTHIRTYVPHTHACIHTITVTVYINKRDAIVGWLAGWLTATTRLATSACKHTHRRARAHFFPLRLCTHAATCDGARFQFRAAAAALHTANSAFCIQQTASKCCRVRRNSPGCDSNARASVQPPRA